MSLITLLYSLNFIRLLRVVFTPSVKIKIVSSSFVHSIVATILCRNDEEENNNSRYGKFHRFLCPFFSKFPDLNFAPYVLYIYSCYMKRVSDTNSEPGLPVVMLPLISVSSPIQKT